MIAAALVRHHLKLAARERRGGTGAAEMDEGREILPLLGLAFTSGARARTSATWRSRYTDVSSMAWLGIARI